MRLVRGFYVVLIVFSLGGAVRALWDHNLVALFAWIALGSISFHSLRVYS